MTGCPGSTAAGCRCTEHHPGLTEFAREPEALELALDKLRPDITRLRIVTMPDPIDPCDGNMTCSCQACIQERGARRAAPPIRQPWEARPSRHAA